MKTLNWFTTLLLCFVSYEVLNAQWSEVDGGMNEIVHALCEFNGELYAGGIFIEAGGVPADNIAKWDGNSWSAVGTIYDATTVNTLIVYHDEIYAGTDQGLRKYNGTSWEQVGNDPPNHSSSLCIYNDMIIVFSGNIYGWNGTDWITIAPGAGSGYGSVAVFQGELYVGGDFSSINSIPFNNIARWNGTTWQSVGSGIIGLGGIADMGVYNNELWVSGTFDTTQGNAGNYLMRWNGSNWIVAGDECSGYVKQFTVAYGKLFVGGIFTSINGVPADNIAYFDGNQWHNMSSGLYGASNSFCSGIAAYNNQIYAGGNFIFAGGVSAFYVARWGNFIGEEPILSSESSVSVQPNPFVNSTSFNFNLSTTQQVTLEIFDMAGRTIQVFLDHEMLAAGSYSYRFLPRKLSAGNFFYKLSYGSKSETGMVSMQN